MLSKRFIGAYNKIDKKLRQLYNVKSNATFPDTVRRAAASSALIRTRTISSTTRGCETPLYTVRATT